MGVIGPSQRNLRRWGMTSKPTLDTLVQNRQLKTR